MKTLRKEIEDEFNEIDTDKSGYLDEKEVEAAIVACGYKLTPEELKMIFRDMDSSGDGKVSKEEFCTAIESVFDAAKHEQAMLIRAFRHFDKDNSGTIDMKELGALFEELGEKMPTDRLKTVMEVIDQDGSGTIDLEEFLEAFTMQ